MGLSLCAAKAGAWLHVCVHPTYGHAKGAAFFTAGGSFTAYTAPSLCQTKVWVTPKAVRVFCFFTACSCGGTIGGGDCWLSSVGASST